MTINELMRYYHCGTYKQLADKLGVTKARVGQYKKNGVPMKLQERLHKESKGELVVREKDSKPPAVVETQLSKKGRNTIVQANLGRTSVVMQLESLLKDYTVYLLKQKEGQLQQEGQEPIDLTITKNRLSLYKGDEICIEYAGK